jgi:hypothetical protein
MFPETHPIAMTNRCRSHIGFMSAFRDPEASIARITPTPPATLVSRCVHHQGLQPILLSPFSLLLYSVTKPMFPKPSPHYVSLQHDSRDESTLPTFDDDSLTDLIRWMRTVSNSVKSDVNTLKLYTIPHHHDRHESISRSFEYLYRPVNHLYSPFDLIVEAQCLSCDHSL